MVLELLDEEILVELVVGIVEDGINVVDAVEVTNGGLLVSC